VGASGCFCMTYLDEDVQTSGCVWMLLSALNGDVSGRGRPN